MKNIILMLFIVVLTSTIVFGQNKDSIDSKLNNKDSFPFLRIFTEPQIYAMFPGGKDELEKYLKKNLNKSLKKQLKKGIKIVIYVSFIIDCDGNLSKFEIANNEEVNKELAYESIRIIKEGPKWLPAIYDGRNVYSRLMQPVIWQR